MRREWLTFLCIATAFGDVLAGCTNMVIIRPIQPGTPLVKQSGYGLAHGRIEIIRSGEDELAAIGGSVREFGWSLTHQESGKRMLVNPLTETGLFVINLPAGRYQVTSLEYSERSGVWEGSLPATFSVEAGGITYIGAWQIQMVRFGSGGKISGRVLNQLEDAREYLKHNHPGSSGPITVGLLESGEQGYFSLVRPRSEQ